MLPELLGRATAIPVEQAHDGTRIRANRAYVIPPDATMSVADGHLHVVQRAKGRGLHLPIDKFLSSLAQVHGAGAIAVILSGAGSDGARGVEAIKEMGGITFAQDTESARHPNMPQAAIATGSVDFVLPPEEIANRLGQIAAHLTDGTVAESTPIARDEDVVAILKLLQRQTGVDFTSYRHGTVQRRILRRMLVHRKSTHREYLDLIRDNPSELGFLFEDLLIGVTSFFRDPAVFADLRATVFPELMRVRPPGAPFRVWVAGCSGGEETYSIAIALLEFLEETGSDIPVQFFGTDLSDAAVARARAGVYPESISEHVSPERLRRFFVSEHGKYRIAKVVRDLCVFSRQNLVRDPPFSHLDLISCRNVLIYFEPSLQRRVLPIFHYALEPYGMLLLGNAESPGAASDLFEPVDKRHRLYRRRDTPSRWHDVNFAQPSGPTAGQRPPAPRRAAATAIAAHQPNTLGQDLDHVFLAHFARQGVVVNEAFEIIHFRGDTTPFLAHRPGAASLNLLQLVRPELVAPIRLALGRAAADDRYAVERLIPFSDGDRKRHATIQVLPLPTASRGAREFVVLFEEDSPDLAPNPTSKQKGPPKRDAESNELESVRAELAAATTYLGEIVEQHEVTVEELRAASEELQSSNEELQSTNEELETAKEEVQSTNEELTTLNEELRHRNRELGELASDIANIFASTTVPIVIVGRDLRLRRFTPSTNRVMRVVPTDVGRPLSDIKLGFALPDLEHQITNTIQTLAVTERVVHDERGAWWSVSIRPYQTVDRRVDGAVLVFTDIDTSKRAERRAEETSESRRQALVAAEEARVMALARTNDALAQGLADREHAEADRNRLLRMLSSAQEEERRRLSRELHDEAGQHLTALALGLQALSAVAPPGSELDRRAEQLRTLTTTLGQELHAIAARLRPKVLDDFGLEAALSSYAEEWSKQTGIAIDVHADRDARRLPTAVESAAYRVFQEALTNVAKHSRATRASVVAERRGGFLHVIVEDDGKGFDPHRVGHEANGTRLGLLGIRERVALLGGSLEIESKEGGGTTLFVRIPFDGAKIDRDTTVGERGDG
jgi:two-component system CheB/CheR fusion protein